MIRKYSHVGLSEINKNITIIGYKNKKEIFVYRENTDKLRIWKLVEIPKILEIDVLKLSSNIEIFNIAAQINEKENLETFTNLLKNELLIIEEVDFNFVPKDRVYVEIIHNIAAYTFGLISYDNAIIPENQINKMV